MLKTQNKLLNQEALQINEVDFFRLLGYPATAEISDMVKEQINKVKEWYKDYGEPYVARREMAILSIESDKVYLEGDFVFTSLVLAKRLEKSGCKKVIVAALSAGQVADNEITRLWADDCPDEAFILDRLTAVITEAFVKRYQVQLCQEFEPFQKTVIPHYSPGYTGWELSEQVCVYEALTESVGELPFEIISSGAITNRSGIFAVYGVTENLEAVKQHADLCPCTHCALTSCAYRRKSDLPAEPLHTYSYSPRVLKRWIKNYLSLEEQIDGSLKGKFTYKGSTCSNGGVKLDFEYHTDLVLKDGRYHIQETSCFPVKDNFGYKSTCPYPKQGDEILKVIGDDRPFVGEALDETLKWDPEVNPSGCMCTKTRRDHKWKMVFQTLHFAIYGEK